MLTCVQQSLLTAQCSLVFSSHYSLLTAHLCSAVTTHCSVLTCVQQSLLTAQCSLVFSSHCSLLTAQCSLVFSSHYSLLTAHLSSAVTTHCSVLTCVQQSLLILSNYSQVQNFNCHRSKTMVNRTIKSICLSVYVNQTKPHQNIFSELECSSMQLHNN